MRPRLYWVSVKGGGRFLYDTVDVSRFVLAMAEAEDTRPFTVKPVGWLSWLRLRWDARGSVPSGGQPGMSEYTHTANGRTWRLYGCAKRGCDQVSPDYMSFGAGDKGYCLHHIPLRWRVKLWWRERRS